MTAARQAPYGSWTSPITSDLIVAATIGLAQPRLDGEDIYWQELRPNEGGRLVVVHRSPDGSTRDVNPAPLNARTRVHEYGGGAVLVDAATVYFSDFADQRLYRARPGEAPVALTRSAGVRYADGVIDRQRNRLICVREDHTDLEREPVNTIVAIDLDSGTETVLVAGNDFYAAARLSADSRLCWLTWHHPNMPWDGCELHVAAVRADGSLADSSLVAGGPAESVVQPEWSADGTLYFASDRTGWWNLYGWGGGKPEPITSREAEFAGPAWIFGATSFAVESPGRIICAYSERGRGRLASLDTATGTLTEIATPYTTFAGVQARSGRAVFIGASPTRSEELVSLDLASGRLDVLRRSTSIELDSRYVSVPETIEFPTEDGLTAWAHYYPPRNDDFVAPDGELPPLLLVSHGGPTAESPAVLGMAKQFWTSRGFALLDVNYGGSSGYGRAYRDRLAGRWGVVDVDDCANAARFVAEQGLADPDRLAIRGGSAGGFTTLAALTFRDVFRAGASHFGVSDLEPFAQETHKFESRYLDGLVGPYPAARATYVERSPIHHVEHLNCPLILFQGLEDEVVPPKQAETMVAALRARGVPVSYVPFDGEQHGFRIAANIKRSFDAELYFYGRVFGFDPAGAIEPVEIHNLAG